MFQKIYVTGFKKFGKHQENPTEILVNSLTPEEMQELRIHKKFTIDVTCQHVDAFQSQELQVCLQELKQTEKALIIHCGVGPNLNYYLEQCGYNCKDFNIPDNSGYCAKKQLICKEHDLDKPIDTRLPLKQIQAALNKIPIPTSISQDPGRYLCNYIYFTTLNRCSNNPNIYCLFVHLPTLKYTSKQENRHFLKKLIEIIQETK